MLLLKNGWTQMQKENILSNEIVGLTKLVHLRTMVL